MKNLIRNKKAEGYIDTVICTLAIMMLLVFALNIFSFLNMKQDMDFFAKEMVSVATETGKISGEQLDKRYSELCTETGISPTYSFNGSKVVSTNTSLVQLGDTMLITLTYDTEIKGFGIFKTPISLTVTQSGLSHKYWKV